MNYRAIEIMGPEFVLMLGVWWGVAVILTVLFLAAKRGFVIWQRRRTTTRGTTPAPSGHVET